VFTGTPISCWRICCGLGCDSLGFAAHLFRRRAGPISVQQRIQHDLLRELCADDAQLYEALSYALVLKPHDREPFDAYLRKPAEAEQQGSVVIAYSNYLIAGQISLFQGKKEEVRRCFSKCMQLFEEGGQRFSPLVEQTNRALEIAREYYRRRSLG